MTDQVQDSANVASEKKRRFPKRKDKSSSINDHRIKNPCHEEAALSSDCMLRHSTEKDAKEQCADYFQNYKKCRDFWSRVQSDRRKKGIQPALPEIQDREAVMEQYKHLFKKK